MLVGMVSIMVIIIDGLFTFNNPKANAEDHQIRSTYGKNNYYQYGITMFHNVVPK